MTGEALKALPALHYTEKMEKPNHLQAAKPCVTSKPAGMCRREKTDHCSC